MPDPEDPTFDYLSGGSWAEPIERPSHSSMIEHSGRPLPWNLLPEVDQTLIRNPEVIVRCNGQLRLEVGRDDPQEDDDEWIEAVPYGEAGFFE